MGNCNHIVSKRFCYAIIRSNGCSRTNSLLENIQKLELEKAESVDGAFYDNLMYRSRILYCENDGIRETYN